MKLSNLNPRNMFAPLNTAVVPVDFRYHNWPLCEMGQFNMPTDEYVSMGFNCKGNVVGDWVKHFSPELLAKYKEFLWAYSDGSTTVRGAIFGVADGVITPDDFNEPRFGKTFEKMKKQQGNILKALVGCKPYEFASISQIVEQSNLFPQDWGELSTEGRYNALMGFQLPVGSLQDAERNYILRMVEFEEYLTKVLVGEGADVPSPVAAPAPQASDGVHVAPAPTVEVQPESQASEAAPVVEEADDSATANALNAIDKMTEAFSDSLSKLADAMEKRINEGLEIQEKWLDLKLKEITQSLNAGRGKSKAKRKTRATK